jgi:hypothetical protein
LERTEAENDPAPDGGAARLRSPHGAGPDVDAVPGAVPVPVSPLALFRAPGLALLAAVSVLEGYRWIGVIANSGSRPWGVAFAAVAVFGGLALTRAEQGQPRSTIQRTLATTAVAVALATVVVLWNHEGWTAVVLGIADLTLASTALAALVAGERARRRDDVTS